MHHSRLQYAKQNSTARNCTRSNNLGTPTHELHCSAPNSRSYNYIFKVLFTTPSWYVFPIGFGHMSRFWWSAPPVHIPVQRNATQILYAVHWIKQIAYGSITLIGSVLQTGSNCTLTGNTHIYNNSMHTAMIRDVTYSLFIRNDWRHPMLFIILRLPICLNLAGTLAWIHVQLIRIFIVMICMYA